MLNGVNFEDVFGSLKDYVLWTDDLINEGDEIVLVNKNCEFEFDNKLAVFQTDLMYNATCDLELVNTNYSDYDPAKSNNGGSYAFVTCKVLKVKDRSY